MRSTSSSTPTTRRRASRTTRWRMPWSSISRNASAGEAVGAIVTTGDVMTSASGVVRPRARRDDPRAQVAVGDDPEPVAARRRGRTPRRRCSMSARRVADAEPGPADQRRPHERRRPAGRTGRVGGAARGSPAASRCAGPGDRADEERHGLRPLQDRPHDLLRQAQQHAVLRGARDVTDGLLGEHRRVAEHLALADEILQPPAARAARPRPPSRRTRGATARPPADRARSRPPTPARTSARSATRARSSGSSRSNGAVARRNAAMSSIESDLREAARRQVYQS